MSNDASPLSPYHSDYDAIARKAGLAAKEASEKRQAAALVLATAQEAFDKADRDAVRLHKDLLDLVGADRAGFYLSR